MGIKETQKSSAAAAQAMSAAAEKTQAETLRSYQRQLDRQTETKSLSKMMDRSAHERGSDIVSQAVAAFAKSSVGKAFFRKDKIEQQMAGKDSFGDIDEAQDKLQLTQRTRVQKIEKLTESLREQYQKLDVDAKGMLREYSDLYTKVITTSSAAASARLDQLEKKLKTKGVTNNQLFELKLLVKSSLRGSVVNQIKDAFLKRMVTTDMVFEWTASTRGLNEIIAGIIDNDLLGGVDFGNYEGGLQGSVTKAGSEVAGELRIVLKEMLDQKMTERLVSEKVSPEEVKKELADYLTIAKRIGFNATEYLHKSWKKTYIDEGLFAFTPPAKDSLINPQMSNNHQQEQEKEAAEYVPEKEQTEEFYLASLRAAYMSKALGHGWRSSLRAGYKIRKVKNNMIKLGIYYDELNEKIKKEAELIAVAKIMEMINESFLERGTLYKLSGPAHQLNETKILSLMKNAAKLGLELGAYELKILQDKANLQIFGVAKRELRLTMVSLSVKNSPALKEKKDKLVKLLKRLKEESDITEDIGLSEEEIRDKLELSI